MDEQLIVTLFVVVQIEFLFLITLLLIFLLHEHKRRKKKADPLVKHIKEYLVEGYTLRQVHEKLHKLGFEKERIDKLITEFTKV